jgi:hypothetical protein
MQYVRLQDLINVSRRTSTEHVVIYIDQLSNSSTRSQY